jgi:hypothetical protein
MARKRPIRRKRKNPATPPVMDWPELLGMIFDSLGFQFRQQQPQAAPVIPPELYRKLLMLCHPDKHGNSETSTEVTRWLIDMREKAGHGK